MYSKETLESYATFSNILKILKRDPRFNEYCSQSRVAAGTSIPLSKERNACYLLESGYVKYNFSGEDGMRNYYIVYPGRFIVLPIVQEYVPNTGELVFLNESVYWTIDFEFLRKMLFNEDPRNYIMLQFSVETRYKLYVLATMRNITAEERVLFTLIRLANFGMHVSANRVDLPSFITYNMVAELAGTSKSFATLTLKNLRDKGILDSSKRPWVIEDMLFLQEALNISDIPSF
ncbi:Crp/Fnr family transcriptional regulator [Listeria booriae]|uniref:Crp/Fnr family transcriptional regulator n=1 Tax=Listeria booriae TaxID=1552123 RepID=UPI00162501B4|nr:Crp/Fnr family transcriptional regulator [Listeria booriae]MBC1514155.1 Crp/Fnr family transcriptional regulator [Listeria booriae]MBC6307585.1 Crp/Fnr family transcriptional regulator [Listeria booriae]